MSARRGFLLIISLPIEMVFLGGSVILHTGVEVVRTIVLFRAHVFCKSSARIIKMMRTVS